MAVRLGGSMLQAAMKTYESQCRRCKKIFLHTEEHAYKGCCTWNCLCRLREQEEHEKKTRGTKIIIRTEAQALARINVCKEKIAKYEQMKDEIVNQKNKRCARGLAWEWRGKLREAERALRVLRGEDADEEDD